ncbi:MAG: hypothetical protein ABI183_10020, partial [Polyangiaceae bacterium]
MSTLGLPLTVAALVLASSSCSSNDNKTSLASALAIESASPIDGGVARLDSGSTATGSFDVRPTFTFESGPVRPVAMSSDGTHLFVANSANASLDVFTVSASGVTPAGSTYVGIDPVAVAARTTTEVWVVNQLSDSVSVVDTSIMPPHVIRTLLVGDEPSDIVFGGPGKSRAFITTAHRGQQRSQASIANAVGAGDPQLTTAGIGRADVWVFDATNLGTGVGAAPIKIVTLFGDTPRALAVTPDGKTVYAAIFKSGNGTMATSSELPCPGFDDATHTTPCVVEGVSIPGAPPGPATNHAGIPGPAVSMLLKLDNRNVWRDQLGRDWTNATAFTLPDQDVFAVDTTTLGVSATYSHVGTT